MHLTRACAWLAHSTEVVSCSLDYPGIGPEHSFLKDVGRAEYYAVTDAEALEAFQRVSQLEGIIPALETSHAFAYLEVGKDSDILYSCTRPCTSKFRWWHLMHCSSAIRSWRS